MYLNIISKKNIYFYNNLVNSKIWDFKEYFLISKNLNKKKLLNNNTFLLNVYILNFFLKKIFIIFLDFYKIFKKINFFNLKKNKYIFKKYNDLFFLKQKKRWLKTIYNDYFSLYFFKYNKYLKKNKKQKQLKDFLIKNLKKKVFFKSKFLLKNFIFFSSNYSIVKKKHSFFYKNNIIFIKRKKLKYLKIKNKLKKNNNIYYFFTKYILFENFNFKSQKKRYLNKFYYFSKISKQKNRNKKRVFIPFHKRIKNYYRKINFINFNKLQYSKIYFRKWFYKILLYPSFTFSHKNYIEHLLYSFFFVSNHNSLLKTKKKKIKKIQKNKILFLNSFIRHKDMKNKINFIYFLNNHNFIKKRLKNKIKKNYLFFDNSLSLIDLNIKKFFFHFLNLKINKNNLFLYNLCFFFLKILKKIFLLYYFFFFYKKNNNNNINYLKYNNYYSNYYILNNNNSFFLNILKLYL